jgi:hypothetical protein
MLFIFSYKGISEWNLLKLVIQNTYICLDILIVSNIIHCLINMLVLAL